MVHILTRNVLVDLAIAIVCGAFAAAAVGGLDSDTGEVTGVSIALIVVAVGALMGRRYWPIPVMIVVLGARVLVAAETGSELVLAPAAIVALYTVARSARGRDALVIAIGAATASGVLVALSVAGDEPFAVELVGEVALLLLPIAAGDAMRARHERMQTRIETEAQARVQEERLRIARDLHDVVAHGLSTIAVQSGIAGHLLDTKPANAREALGVINSTSKRTLEELRSMVGALRSTDEAPLAPTLSHPDDFEPLIDAATTAGLTVEVASEGSFPSDASDACIVAAHRILQEAMTNVARHAGPVPVRLSVEHDGDAVHLEVWNGPGLVGDREGSTGVGMIGMKERAASVGGNLEAAKTPDGGFLVRATLPYGRRRG